MSNVEIIIPTYNRSKTIKETLNSLQRMKTDITYSITIVDDSENDKTKELCENIDLNIKYLNPKTGSTSAAKNYGWNKSDSEFIVFIDDDVIIQDYWLDNIMEELHKDGVGVAGGPALEINEKNEMIHKLTNASKNLNRVKKGFVKEESHRWIPPEVVEVDVLRGANQAFRREVLEETSGFDENYIGNCFREETDLHVRAKRKGYKIHYNPKAKIKHKENSQGGTRDKSKEFWYSLGYNQKRFIEKLFPEYQKLHTFKLIFSWNYAPYSLTKIILSSLKNREIQRLNYLKGYFNSQN